MADLIKIFEAINTQMIVDFEKIHSQVEHMGGRGREREECLKQFLESYLPHQYAIASGEIVDSRGNTSRQCDLIVYDAASCPLLLAGQDYRIFPAESVYAVIEVKSVLDNRQLDKAIENNLSVKNLERENGKIGGIVFAYKSNKKKEVIEKLEKLIQQRNTSLLPSQNVDLWCILDSGIVALVSKGDMTRPTDELSERMVVSYYRLDDPPILLWFFAHLLHLLDGQKVINPDYMEYIHARLIGLVSISPPTYADDL